MPNPVVTVLNIFSGGRGRNVGAVPAGDSTDKSQALGINRVCCLRLCKRCCYSLHFFSSVYLIFFSGDTEIFQLFYIFGFNRFTSILPMINWVFFLIQTIQRLGQAGSDICTVKDISDFSTRAEMKYAMERTVIHTNTMTQIYQFTNETLWIFIILV